MAYEFFYGKQAEQYQFYKLPKILIKEDSLKKISMDAKVLYSLMLDRAALSAENGWLDEFGRVYIIYTLDEICRDMSCAREKAVKLLNELEEGCGLIRRKRQRLCKPNLIYVMNFATDYLKFQKPGASSSKIEPPGVRKSNHREFENRTLIRLIIIRLRIIILILSYLIRCDRIRRLTYVPTVCRAEKSTGLIFRIS